MSYKLSLIAPDVSLSIFELSVLSVPWEKTEPLARETINQSINQSNKQTKKNISEFLHLYLQESSSKSEISSIICIGHI